MASGIPRCFARNLDRFDQSRLSGLLAEWTDVGSSQLLSIKTRPRPLPKRPALSQAGNSAVILIVIAGADAADIVRFLADMAVGVLPENILLPTGWQDRFAGVVRNPERAFA